MILTNNTLTIRGAAESDAEQLCKWWNDGAVMAHAGFPDGLGTSAAEVCGRIAANGGLHIIELAGCPIGEMNARNAGAGVAEIGIKICEADAQGQKHSVTLLSIFIDALFNYEGYGKIILDTNLTNTRAQHVYEKLGFRRLGVRENSWQDQRGAWQSAVDYEMEKAEWRGFAPYIRLRREEEADFRAVENLTREAFWVNSGVHDVDEHYLAHMLRQSPDFVPALDIVAEIGGRLAGNVMFSRARVIHPHGRETAVLNFGPLSVLPEYQNQGVGRAIMTYAIAEARRLGHRAIVFFGHPDYYPRLGFRRAAEFGITTKSGGMFDPHMAMELVPGALADAAGYFQESTAFDMDEESARAFEQSFPPKEKQAPMPMETLLSRLPDAPRASLTSLGMTYADELRTRSERELLALPGMDAAAVAVIRAAMEETGRRWGRRVYDNR